MKQPDKNNLFQGSVKKTGVAMQVKENLCPGSSEKNSAVYAAARKLVYSKENQKN